MKKAILIFCLLITSVISAQKIVKYKSVSSFFIERIDGKKGISKPKKANTEILFDIDNKVITLRKQNKQVFKITELKPIESGSNFTISNFGCLDENKVECNLSIITFSKPNKNGVLHQLFIAYKKIEYVYDMNLIEN